MLAWWSDPKYDLCNAVFLEVRALIQTMQCCLLRDPFLNQNDVMVSSKKSVYESN